MIALLSTYLAIQQKKVKNNKARKSQTIKCLKNFNVFIEAISGRRKTINENPPKKK